MRTLYERIGGEPVVTATVDGLYDRLTRDPRIRHHFEPSRLEGLKAAQRRWFTSVLGGTIDGERPDLSAAHAHLDITDQHVGILLAHLDDSLADAGLEPGLRRPVTSLVSRLWHARVF
jgi:truncated hemoglobin YjbI